MFLKGHFTHQVHSNTSTAFCFLHMTNRLRTSVSDQRDDARSHSKWGVVSEAELHSVDHASYLKILTLWLYFIVFVKRLIRHSKCVGVCLSECNWKEENIWFYFFCFLKHLFVFPRPLPVNPSTLNPTKTNFTMIWIWTRWSKRVVLHFFLSLNSSVRFVFFTCVTVRKVFILL